MRARRAQHSEKEVHTMKSQLHPRTRLGFILIPALLLLAAFATAGWAQEAGASITGRITDPAGSAVASATVTARDMDRGTVWKTQTNDEGAYTLPRLPIGNYQVRV